MSFYHHVWPTQPSIRDGWMTCGSHLSPWKKKGEVRRFDWDCHSFVATSDVICICLRFHFCEYDISVVYMCILNMVPARCVLDYVWILSLGLASLNLLMCSIL